MTDLDGGTAAVRLARDAIAHVLGPTPARDPAAAFRDRPLPAEFEEPRGVFVTLRSPPDDRLRGCIGYPVPVYPLRVAIPRVAAASALEDPRFPPVRSRELPELTVEVSILTVPEPIPAGPPERIVELVKVGRDGLIVDGDGQSGLLLPQVAVEEGWDSRTFLAETCRKAGLRPEAWRGNGVRVRRFSAEVFAEAAPAGAVRRRTGD